ncbi:MAG TPA: hypothetical protein VFR31_20240 [Thermoanaerobaculia bacterium]|nr:hypothetical protein [Thermoanaerobaculia bacterium]
MKKTMKMLVLAVACIAAALSVAPLVAQDDQQDYTPGSGGGGGAWYVSCSYNGSEQLVSKNCSSGGRSSCNCP